MLRDFRFVSEMLQLVLTSEESIDSIDEGLSSEGSL